MSQANPDSTEEPRRAGLFATTLWTVVLDAGSHESAKSRPALERLCQTYWYPIYAHVRRHGYAAHDAQDLTQGFFASLIPRQPFENLSTDKGRFRSFLLAALRNFLADDRDRANAAKRGGGQVIMSLDETQAEERYSLEPSTKSNPEKEFDRRWALEVMERALDALAREQIAAEKESHFMKLKPFLIEPAESGDYESVAREMGVNPNTIAVTVRRLRDRYRNLVRAEIADTLADPTQVQAEMTHLLAAIRQ